MSTSPRHLLLILDGYGLAVDTSVSAIDHANKPYLDELFARYPMGTLEASGLAVGLPEGQMGNSEVGHMNLGAGRVVYQEITRIDKDIREGGFFKNEVLLRAVRQAIETGGNLHCLGLFSDGGVHSHNNHLVALLQLAANEGLTGDRVCVHAFMDGRDTDPHGGLSYVRDLEAAAEEIGSGTIASVIGRYYAMDRDNRWERTQLAYDLLVHGEGKTFGTAAQALESSYADGVTDEFVLPCRIGETARIKDGDAVIFFNYRADRARQITRALTDPAFAGFERESMPDLHYVTFAPYDASFNLPIAFPKVNLIQTMGEIIEAQGWTQLRAAETEKYPHVTYFFSGGREDPFVGEDRILEPSPKVPTYDLQPEMSVSGLAARVADALRAKDYRFAVVNFANPDMVGHTGVFEAAVKAIEAVDDATRVVVEAAIEAGYGITIIADHGNADCMRNPDGSPNTAHTTALVPHLIIRNGVEGPIRPGKLGDVTPTILHMLGVVAPPEVTGDILI